MFVLAKLLDIVTQPLAWVALCLAVGLVASLRWPRLGKGLLWSSLGILLVQSWTPLPNAVLHSLEAQYPAPEHIDWSHYEGVIVLGGALESSEVWEGHAQPALNGAAERMTAGVALLHRAPHLRLLFTGGNGELIASALTEAERASRFYADQGVDPKRLVFESASRSTHENAVLSAQVAGIDPKRPWLLLTSAWHMPRAMATFQKAGWNVTPWPTDYRTGPHTPWHAYSITGAAGQWQTALHEILGLWVYRWTGRA